MTDYAIHAKISELQQRLYVAENTIAALSAEIDRINGFKPVTRQNIPTSIPLVPMQPSFPVYQSSGFRLPPQHAQHTSQSRGGFAGRFQRGPNDAEPIPTNLSDILNEGETTTFTINTGKDANGLTQATTKAVFDGTNLTITECATIPHLVGMKTTKPGEILFKFMNDLKEKGIIQRTFNALPWRLCSVEREGVKLTLSQLRKNLQETQ
jgi:hypothetical protein